MSEFSQIEPTDWIESVIDSELPRTCIVTGEFVGLHRNGGLGTAMTGLAQLLSENGFSVTVIYTGHVDADTEHWVTKYSKVGIKVLPLKFERQSHVFGPQVHEAWTNAWAVFEYLKGCNFEVIHFNDTQGEGCYCFLAKKFGIAFQNTLLSLAAHSPVEWILESNRAKPHSLWYSLCITGEKFSFWAADLVWAPSNYLLAWLNNHNYRLADQVFRQQYVIPTDWLFDTTRSPLKSSSQNSARQQTALPREIVFFGRLEERKGIRLFVGAITRIKSELATNGISVLFMGKQSEVDGQPVASFLNQQAANWSFSWRIEDQFDQQDAINYLKSSNCLAVIASPVDNSPCTVYEVLSHGIPFIACNSGGIPELIDPEFHESSLFEYNTSTLAERLVALISGPPPVPRPSIPVEENQLRWLNFHRHWKKYLPAKTKLEEGLAKWGVYIDCLGTVAQMSDSLNAIDRLDLKDSFAMVLNLRGRSLITKPCAPDVLVLENTFDSSASACIRFFEQKGATHLLLIRVGFEPLQGALKSMERALETDIDAVVPTVRIKSTGELLPPIAGSAALSCIEHRLDSGAMAVCLSNKAFGRACSSLSLNDVHLGLLEQLYSIGAVVSPLPDPVFATEMPENIVVPMENSAKRIFTFSSAPTIDVFQMLSVALRKYPQMSNKFLNRKGVRGYLYSNPPPIQVLFGNRLVRKLSRVLFNLSHQDH